MDSLRRSSLARTISFSGSNNSSPELPRYSSNSASDRSSPSPNTSPGSSPSLSSTSAFPRFVSPFAKKGEQIELGAPADGLGPLPTQSSRSSASLTVDLTKLRKPSVAEFHGDLRAQQATQKGKARRKLLVKIAILALLFATGLLVGVAIGHWGIPYVSKGSGTGSHRTSISTTDLITPDSQEQKAVPTSAAPVSAVAFWQPTSGTTFAIQLSTALTSTTNLPVNILAYDVDLFDTPASTIAGLKKAGKKVICYFSAGTAEDWRDDYHQFQSADLGAEMADWEGEQWVHTPNANVRSIMVARLQLAKDKGCDGVDPDNVDVYSYGKSSGFSDLTQNTAIDYLTYLSGKAHALGLAIGLKNAGEIIPSIQPYMQWVVTEQCADYNECGIYKPFSSNGKPVFNIQYPFGNNNKKTTVSDSMKTKYCQGQAGSPGYTNVMKHMNLDAWSYNCDAV